MLYVHIALLVCLLLAGSDAQSCRGPGFRITGCNLQKPVRDDNRCGIAADQAPCPFGTCCAERGQCGRSVDHCGSEGLPPLGPPRSDRRCGTAEFFFAGCESGSICRETFCLSEDSFRNSSTTEGRVDQTSSDSDQVNTVTPAPMPATPVDPPAVPDCSMSDTCHQLRASKTKSGSSHESQKGQEHDEYIDVIDTVEDQEGYVKSSASLAMTLFAPSVAFVMILIFL